jgi:hypothetical protein
MHMAKGALWIVVLVLAIGAGAGCNSGEKTVSVEGTVTLDGQPLPEAHVMFYPEVATPTEQKFYFGSTDQDGKFVLRSSIDGSEGAPPGKYNVTLTTAVAKQDATETTPLPPERVPPKHRKKEFEVPPEGAEDAKFELTTR